MTPKILVLTVGLPRSGKTTWARHLAASHASIPIVNPDSIRLAMHGQRFVAEAEPLVWAIAKIAVRALFLAGHDTVIVDATNTTQKRRDEWLNPAWTTCFKFFSPSPADCIKRAQATGDTEIIPVIEKMYNQFEPLTETEDLRRWNI